MWGAEFSRVTAAGMKLFLNLLVRERHPVAPPRREEGKQSVAGVRAVLFDAACPPQTSLALDSLNGGE